MARFFRSAVTENAQVPSGENYFDINLNASQIKFGVKYRFINQRAVFSQKFSVGLKIWSLKDDGTINKVMYDKKRIVFPEIGAILKLFLTC